MSGSAPRAAREAASGWRGQALPQPMPSASPGLQSGGLVNVIQPGQATAGLAERLARLSERLDRRADEMWAQRAAEAGTEAGDAEPGTQMQGGGFVYQSAYNRAAVQAGFNRLEVDARTRVDELARTHEADPAGFAAAVQQYRDGLTASLPPALAGPVRNTLDRLGIPYTNQLREQAERRNRDQAVATFQEALPGRIAEIQRLAQRATTDPDAAAALDTARAALRDAALSLGPRGAFRLDGRDVPADATRAGALGLGQIQRLLADADGETDEALILGAWGAGGRSARWIDDWRASQRVPPAGNLLERIFRAENAAGDGRRNAMGSSASGPGQITNRTWDAYAARLGLTPAQRNDRAAHERIFHAYMEDARRSVGRDLSDGEAYAAWVLGIPGLRAFLAADRGADAQAVYARAAGAETAAKAFRQNPGLLEPGMSTGQVLDALERRVTGRLIPLDRVDRIERRLRGELARDEAARQEAERAALAALQPTLRANAAGIAEEGRILAPVSDAQLAAAGYTPEQVARHRAEEQAGLAAWQVRTELRNAATPERIAELAATFAPGTDLFAADPATASRILALARERGAAVGNAGLEARVQDLRAEALATGRPPAPLTAEEGAAAGLPPEAVARLNADLEEAARQGALAAAARGMAPAERAALPAELPVAGPRAAENARLLEVAEREFRAADQALRQDPAAYALAGSPAAQELFRRAQEGLAQGDVSLLPDLVAVLAAEQRRLGVARPEALPRAMYRPMVQAVADARDPVQAAGAARVLLAVTGPEGLLRALEDVTGPQAETRREAIAVAAMIQANRPELARDIFAGAIALRESRPVELSLAQVEAAAQSVVGDAFREMPAARAQLLSAARAVYMAGLAREGREGQVFNAAEFRRAIERVQPFGEYGARRVPLPAGIDQGVLDRLMGDLPPAALAGARAQDGRPVTPAMVARGGFELLPVAPGRFELRYAGRQVLDAEGGPFRLDLARALELAPPGLREPRSAAGLLLDRLRGGPPR